MIKTKNLIIRPFNLHDAKAIFKLSQEKGMRQKQCWLTAIGLSHFFLSIKFMGSLPAKILVLAEFLRKLVTTLRKKQIDNILENQEGVESIQLSMRPSILD